MSFRVCFVFKVYSKSRNPIPVISANLGTDCSPIVCVPVAYINFWHSGPDTFVFMVNPRRIQHIFGPTGLGYFMVLRLISESVGRNTGIVNNKCIANLVTREN